MSTKRLRTLPKLSGIAVNFKRSLLEIGLLLDLRPDAPVKLVAIAAPPVTRWNE
jgi:hypothetical protein